MQSACPVSRRSGILPGFLPATRRGAACRSPTARSSREPDVVLVGARSVRRDSAELNDDRRGFNRPEMRALAVAVSKGTFSPTEASRTECALRSKRLQEKAHGLARRSGPRRLEYAIE